MKSLLVALVFVLSLPLARADVNARLSPLGLLAGIGHVMVDIPVSRNWTIGPSARYFNWSVDDYQVTGYGFGVRANYWFNEDVFTQGWYLGPGIDYLNLSIEEDDKDSNLEGSTSAIALSTLAGYQWMWESFNINLGAGLTYFTAGKVTIEDDEGNEEDYAGFSGIGLALEFTLGWKF